jgi:hypothetical protein
MGDTNYSFASSSHMRYISNVWLSYLQGNYTNCITPPFTNLVHTFYRNKNIRSTLDYVYCTINIHNRIADGQVELIPQAWTDHNLLFIRISMGHQLTGKGVWRFNPILLKNKFFRNYTENSTIGPSILQPSSENCI